MKKKLALALLVLSVSAQAWATDWYQFNFNTLTCLPLKQVAIPQLDTPYKWREEARQSDSYGGTKVFNEGNAGRIVQIRAYHRTLVFTSTHQLCRMYRNVYEHSGHHVTNLNELK